MQQSYQAEPLVVKDGNICVDDVLVDCISCCVRQMVVWMYGVIVLV